MIVTEFLSLPRSLDQLYLDHQRRLDVQVESFLDLQRSVEAQLRFVATAKLILILRYREARLMGERAPEPECRVQDSFCGDTGCEVHGRGPGPRERGSGIGDRPDPDPSRTPDPGPRTPDDESSRSSS